MTCLRLKSAHARTELSMVNNEATGFPEVKTNECERPVRGGVGFIDSRQMKEGKKEDPDRVSESLL
jgi:hypothetical protein